MKPGDMVKVKVEGQKGKVKAVVTAVSRNREIVETESGPVPGLMATTVTLELIP